MRKVIRLAIDKETRQEVNSKNAFNASKQFLKESLGEYDKKELTANMQLLYRILIDYANLNMWKYPVEVTNFDLMKLLRTSSSDTLQRAKQGLRDLGFIDYNIDKGTKATQYTVYTSFQSKKTTKKRVNKETKEQVNEQDNDEVGERVNKPAIISNDEQVNKTTIDDVEYKNIQQDSKKDIEQVNEQVGMTSVDDIEYDDNRNIQQDSQQVEERVEEQVKTPSIIGDVEYDDNQNKQQDSQQGNEQVIEQNDEQVVGKNLPDNEQIEGQVGGLVDEQVNKQDIKQVDQPSENPVVMQTEVVSNTSNTITPNTQNQNTQRYLYIKKEEKESIW